MHVLTSFRCALLGLTLALAGCSKYSSVSTQQLTYGATTPAGVRISAALRHPDKEPLRQIGGYLDAAAIAGQALKTQPDDTQARTDYNFALSRIMEVIHEAGFKPWITPLQCPGEEGPWIVRYETVGPKSPYDPAFFRVLPADRYEFKGRLVTERTIKPGLYTGRTRHYHFGVTLKGQPRFATQLFFKDEPANAKDGILRSLQDEKTAAAVVREFKPVAGTTELAATWDIVLGLTPGDNHDQPAK